MLVSAIKEIFVRILVGLFLVYFGWSLVFGTFEEIIVDGHPRHGWLAFIPELVLGGIAVLCGSILTLKSLKA